jgi:hypothetical protein
MDELVVWTVLLVVINGIVDCTLVAWLAGRRSKRALQNWLMSGDEEMQEMVAKIIGLAIITPVKTGKKIADEDGKEQFEELPLFKYVGRELSNALLYKLKAARGGSLSAAGKDAMDQLDAPSLLGSLGPRKGQTSMEWIMEQAAPRLMPIIEKKVQEMLESKGAGGF